MSEPVSRVEFFRPPNRPTGGGTVYIRPSDSGNPYARIDEDPDTPVVSVVLPPFEEPAGSPSSAA